MLFPYILFSTIWKNGVPILMNGKIQAFQIAMFIIMLAVLTANLFLIKWFYRKIGKKFAKSELKYKPLFWFMVIIEYVVGNMGYADDNLMENKIILVYYSAAVILGILFLYELSLWMRKRKSRQIQQENHILSIENAVMKEYYETLEYQLERTRKFRHDIDKHMTVIKEMLVAKEQGGGVIDYASKVQSEFRNLKQIEYCKNPVVNAILVNKARQCEERGIKFDIDVARLELGNIKEIDLIAVLANVLDNAMEECGKIESDKKQIELKSDVYVGNLIIKVKNSTDKIEITGKVKTEKKDDYAHGVGLSIVKEVIEKYKGTFENNLKDGNYEVIIMLELGFK